MPPESRRTREATRINGPHFRSTQPLEPNPHAGEALRLPDASLGLSGTFVPLAAAVEIR